MKIRLARILEICVYVIIAVAITVIGIWGEKLKRDWYARGVVEQLQAEEKP